MKVSEYISDYFTQVVIVANELTRNGEELNEVRIIKKIPRSMDSKFDHIVVTIDVIKDLEAIMIKQLLRRLQAY